MTSCFDFDGVLNAVFMVGSNKKAIPGFHPLDGFEFTANFLLVRIRAGMWMGHSRLHQDMAFVCQHHT
jgi:hypothetical protein